MIVVSNGVVMDIHVARGRIGGTAEASLDAIAYGSVMILRPSVRPDKVDTVERRTHDHVWFHVPRSSRLMKDVVWLAVLSMALAGIALLSGIIDIFTVVDLNPLTLGAGLASITFGILGLTDRVSGRS